MLTGQAWSTSSCLENAKLCPQVHGLQDAGGSLPGAKTTLALPLGRIPASYPPWEGGGLSITGGSYGEI